MKNRKTFIPITLAELTNVTQSFSTSLEQIEYLAVTIFGLQKNSYTLTKLLERAK